MDSIVKGDIDPNADVLQLVIIFIVSVIEICVAKVQTRVVEMSMTKMLLSSSPSWTKTP